MGWTKGKITNPNVNTVETIAGIQTHGKDSSDSLRAETRSRSLACSASAGTGTVGNSRALNMSVNGTKRVPGVLTVGLQILATGQSHNPTSRNNKDYHVGLELWLTQKTESKNIEFGKGQNPQFFLLMRSRYPELCWPGIKAAWRDFKARALISLGCNKMFLWLYSDPGNTRK